MMISVEPLALQIVQTLRENGFEAYIVGGAVRDLLLKRESDDWDITTNAKPDEVLQLFEESFYDNAYGTVMVSAKHLAKQFASVDSQISDEQVFDITTYRSDGKYTDHRRPDNVSWGKSIFDDLQRRDFTVNAMALDPKGELAGKEVECSLIDPYFGQNDLSQKTIRAVGIATNRFEEDALRILRAIRIAAQLGFTIEEETMSAIRQTAQTLASISWERIGAEFMKLLKTDNAADAIVVMANTHVLDIVMPEFMLGKDVKQAGHHIYDVFTHGIEALRACPSPDPVVRLATLIHDIDKPVAFKAQGVRGVTFYNHEVTGARVAKAIAQRLRLSKKDQDRIFTLVRWHMFSYSDNMTDAAIRRFIRKVGKENISDMMALRVGDRVGGGSKATSWRLTELQRRIGEQLYEPLSLKDLAINGNQIMEILAISPGREIGDILNNLFEEVIDDPQKNTLVYLEKRALEIHKLHQ